MDHTKRMQVRCPGAKFVSAARLDGYKFVYDGRSIARGDQWAAGAVANIVPQAGSSVWGALWEITPEHEAALDGFEDFPIDYQKSNMLTVHDQGGREIHNVLAYFRAPLEPGRPTDEYRALILNGARESQLPKEYIEELEKR